MPSTTGGALVGARPSLGNKGAEAMSPGDRGETWLCQQIWKLAILNQNGCALE
eukprot:CAMPEP_0203982806 /NCGR_PEP_ID=MMETSP0360-20130528/3313_1 /ASSEMBLY_ACC=CAM_ASM_000342 /TAXON_ID=268821 /ORGANISM="Scrippsiella Hangoei, Strain SHTV-5" /LENGTH=52 /DNA_ID=CAMNT_0050921617 /DNA_START=91 /DNA_END=246 /DNA_ORIENTATION=-